MTAAMSAEKRAADSSLRYAKGAVMLASNIGVRKGCEEQYELMCDYIRLHADFKEAVAAMEAIYSAYASNGNTRRQKEAHARVRETLAKAKGRAG